MTAIRITRFVLLAALLADLGGCATWSRYRHLPAGGDAEIWRPQGVAEIDLEQQLADPADLQGGRGPIFIDAGSAASAVDRARRGRAAPLPESSISRIGSGTGATIPPATGGP